MFFFPLLLPHSWQAIFQRFYQLDSSPETFWISSPLQPLIISLVKSADMTKSWTSPCRSNNSDPEMQALIVGWIPYPWKQRPLLGPGQFDCITCQAQTLSHLMPFSNPLRITFSTIPNNCSVWQTLSWLIYEHKFNRYLMTTIITLAISITSYIYNNHHYNLHLRA